MKKIIPQIILLSCLVFFGFQKSYAAVTVKITSDQTPSVNGLNADPVPNGSTNIPVYGFNLTGTGTGSRTITALTFTNSGFSPGFNTAFFTTAYLYTSATNNYVPGVTNVPANLISTYSANASYNLTFNLSITVTSASNLFYFIVLSNTLNSTTVDFEADYLGNTGGGTFTGGNGATGYDYTFAAPVPVTGTATSLTTVAGNSGTSAPATISTANTYTIYGMKIVGSVGGTSAAITTLNFTTSSANGNSYFYGTAYLFAGTIAGPTGGAIGTINPTTASQTLSFTGLAGQTLTAGATLYYFVEIAYSSPGVAANTATTLSFSSAVGPTVSNGAVAGPAYTYQTIPAVIAADLTGASLTPGPAVFLNQLNIAVAGISLKTSTSTTTLSQITFTVNASVAASAAFFANVRLVTSANPFTTGGSLTYTPSNTVTTLTYTFSTPITLTTTTTNFYLVVDYTINGTIGPSFTFNPTNYTTVLSGAVTPAGYVANTYTPTAPVARTYYWWGNGATTDWRLPANWTTTTAGTGANLGTYPGASPADVATFNYDDWQSGSTSQSASIGAYNITFATLNVVNGANNGSYVSLAVNNGYSLSLTTFTLGTTSLFSNGASLSVSGSAAGNVTPSLNTSGVTTVNNTCTLTAAANSIINFPSGSTFTFNGSFFTPAYLSITGGAITAANCAFSFGTGNSNFSNDAGQISVSSGSFTANGGSMTMAGYEPQINVSGGTYTATSTPVTMSGYLPSISVSGGIFKEITSTLTLSGTNSPGLFSSAGESDFLGSTINVTGTYSSGYVMGYTISGGTVNFGGTAAAGNATAANASTFNLGTAAAVGQNARIQLTAGYFNLGYNSIVNILSTNLSAGYYNFYNSGGVVTCASTSIINPTSSSAYIYNNTGNAFTLFSDANGSATIGTLGSSAIVSGLYNVQRYISTASRNYRLLASPVNGTKYLPGTAASPNIVDLLALTQSASVTSALGTVSYPGAFVGGPAGTGGGFTATTGGPTLYLYQESIVPSLTNYNASFYSGKNIAITKLSTTNLTTVSTANAVGGTGATSAANSTAVIVPPGNGYLLYYIHDNTSTSTTATLNACATTARGYINQGTIPLVIWGTSGLNTTSLTNNGVSQVTNPHAFAGLTMVGNPYPSSIDLQKLYTDNTTATAVFTNGTNESFSELDPSNQQFATYAFNGSIVTTSGTNASRYIASGQGFYITVTNGGKVLTFYEDQKTALSPSVILESYPVTNPLNTVDNVTPGNLKTIDAIPATNVNTAVAASSIGKTNIQGFAIKTYAVNQAANNTHVPAKPVIPEVSSLVVPASNNILPVSSTVAPAVLAGMHLKLVQDSLNFDECGIYFSKSGSDNFESNDAKDMDGVSNNVYLSSYSADNIRTSINSLGDYTPGKRVKLYVKFSSNGIFQLQLEDINAFNTNQYSVFLIDNLKKDSLDLTLYKLYNFNYTAGTANDSTRFILAIEHKPVPYYALTAFAGQKVTQGVQLDWTTKNENNTTKFLLQKLSGNNTYLFLDSLSSDSSGTYAYVDQHPSLGNNTYRLQQTDGLGKTTYSSPVTIGYNSTSPNGGLVIYPNPSKTTITVSLSTGSITTQVASADIYNTSGTLIVHKVINSNSFNNDISNYKLGVYIIELKNSSGALIGKSKFVKVQ